MLMPQGMRHCCRWMLVLASSLLGMATTAARGQDAVIAHWPFDSGSEAKDASGHGYDLDLRGESRFVPGGREGSCLESHEVACACEVLIAADLNFMVHRTIPDNHAFAYFESNDGNADFKRRLSLYRQFAVPLAGISGPFGPATQLLAVVPAKLSHTALQIVQNELSDFNVIQATSPLDGESTWIEIFPPTVSKSLTKPGNSGNHIQCF